MKNQFYARFIKPAVVCSLSFQMLFGPASLLAWDIAQDEEDDEELYTLSPFEVSPGGYSVTTGGAQDARHAKMLAREGLIPSHESLTAEGLFSEHDLPISLTGTCDDIICVGGEAMPVEILELPEAEILGQVGFGSSINASWKRDPVNLVAVVDKSGSMSGEPLTLVKESLSKVVNQMGADDQLSIVLYGDKSHVHMEPTYVSTENVVSIKKSISRIQSAGSTYMEEGLIVAYLLASKTADTFVGTTRLMLFTDERPNVGDTSASGFMGLMEAGSKNNVGLTTVGVGTQFGAELANKISSVRGGNLFFFANRSQMVSEFEESFDTMITELGYEMELKIVPSEGFKVSGIYGIPANKLNWIEGRSISMSVNTLFLSKKSGAIYFTLAKEDSSDSSDLIGKTVANIEVSYLQGKDLRVVDQRFAFVVEDKSNSGLGLIRGEYLVNEYVSMIKASTLYHEHNNTKDAYRILTKLANYFKTSSDVKLKDERKFIGRVKGALEDLAGFTWLKNANGISISNSSSWYGDLEIKEDIYDCIVTFVDGRYFELVYTNENTGEVFHQYAVSRKNIHASKKGKIRFMDEDEFYDSPWDELESYYDSEYMDDLKMLKYAFNDNGSMSLKVILRYGHGSMKCDLKSFENSDNYLYVDDFEGKINPLTGLPGELLFGM